MRKRRVLCCLLLFATFLLVNSLTGSSQLLAGDSSQVAGPVGGRVGHRR